MAERIMTPSQDFGWLRADAADLDKKLRTGDGLAWAGDPSLDLRQGIIEETRSGRLTGNIVARRWEVWRACEDGIDRLVGHWRMEEFDRIIFDLVRMRAEAPGHVDVIDSIDAGNKKAEDKIWSKGHDALGTMMDHMARLHADTTGPKQVFRGIPGQNPDKQL